MTFQDHAVPECSHCSFPITMQLSVLLFGKYTLLTPQAPYTWDIGHPANNSVCACVFLQVCLEGNITHKIQLSLSIRRDSTGTSAQCSDSFCQPRKISAFCFLFLFFVFFPFFFFFSLSLSLCFSLISSSLSACSQSHLITCDHFCCSWLPWQQLGQSTV